MSSEIGMEGWTYIDVGEGHGCFVLLTDDKLGSRGDGRACEGQGHISTPGFYRIGDDPFSTLVCLKVGLRLVAGGSITFLPMGSGPQGKLVPPARGWSYLRASHSGHIAQLTARCGGGRTDHRLRRRSLSRCVLSISWQTKRPTHACE